MEIKVIEGTNGKYFIREDGLVLKLDGSLLLPNKPKYPHLYSIRINKKTIYINGEKLLLEYFGYKFCNRCDDKFTPDLSPKKCNKCKKELKSICLKKHYKKNSEKIKKAVKDYRKNNPEKRNKTKQNWNKNNPEKRKNHLSKYNKKTIENINKAYVAKLLGIKIGELSDPLYEHHKNLILLKRKVSAQYNIPINSLNF